MDLTGRSLRTIRRGTLVVPGRGELMIERVTTDPASGSPRGESDVTGTSLRGNSAATQMREEVHVSIGGGKATMCHGTAASPGPWPMVMIPCAEKHLLK